MSWYALRCKVGIVLKLAGCALIHGWGRHYYAGPVVEYLGERTTACLSCGKYKRMQPVPSTT
jgi:hypothetical protein